MKAQPLGVAQTMTALSGSQDQASGFAGGLLTLFLKQPLKGRIIAFLAMAAFILCLAHGEISYARSINFPSTWLLYEDATYTAVVEELQQNNRESLISCIARDPLLSRQVLISLLREQDKYELARSFAELFRITDDSELEIPLVKFFSKADPETRERLLHWAAIITDAEWFLSSNDYPDRFSRETESQALQDLQAATREFHEMGFVDGEAYCLNAWSRFISDAKRMEAEQTNTVEKAMRLFQQTGNLRGETQCLVNLAGLSLKHNDPKITTELIDRALEKAAADNNPVLQARLWGWKQYQVEGKVRREAIVRLRLEVKSEPGLRDVYYGLLLAEPVNLEEYHALLTTEKKPVQAIRAHLKLSEYLERSDKLQQSIDELDRAIELARMLPYDMGAYGSYPHPAVAWMFYERAQKNRDLGKLREAENDCHQALQLLESEKATSHFVQTPMVFVWYELSFTYRALGEYPLAIDAAQHSLDLALKMESTLGIQSAHQAMAEVYSELGDLTSAEEHLQEAIRQPHAYFNASPLQMAELHLNFQLYEVALRDLESVEPAMRAYLELRPWQQTRWFWPSKKYRLLTYLYLRLGEPERAMEFASKLEKQVHPGPEGLVGIVLAEMKRYTEAENYFLDRLNSIQGKDALAKEVDAHKNLGKIYRAQRKPAPALVHLDKALELYQKLGDRRGEIEVLLELGRVQLESRDLAIAKERLNQALQRSEDAQDQQGIWSAHYGMAHVARAESQPMIAADHLKLAVEAVEKVSGHLNVDLYKSEFLENKIVIYDELIRLLGPSHPAEAFNYAERRQSRAFLEAVQKRVVASQSGADELHRKKEEVEGRLIGKQRALVAQLSKPDSQRDYALIESLRRELRDVRAQHTQLLKTVELRNPAEAALQAEVTPRSAQQVQTEILGHNQALIEYVVTDQEVLAFVLDRSSCKFVRSPISRKTLNAQVRQLHLPFQQLRQGRTDLLHLSYDVSLAHDLYKTLFLPLESLLLGKTDIIVVPDEALNYLPFESLARSRVTGEKIPAIHYAEYREVDWLVRHYTVRYAFSATSLDPKLREALSPQGELVAFGISGATGSENTRIARAVLRRASEDGAVLPSLPPLPLAAKESRRVAQIMAGRLGTRVFTDGQATESAFFREAPAAGYLHLAVHSLLNNEQPYYSALLLAPEVASDGLLQTFEIASTHLNARLVTLSGCETALGKMVRGEGLLGLRRAFLQAGARSVLVSLWSVEDSSADFMEEFYKNLGKDLSLGGGPLFSQDSVYGKDSPCRTKASKSRLAILFLGAVCFDHNGARQSVNRGIR